MSAAICAPSSRPSSHTSSRRCEGRMMFGATYLSAVLANDSALILRSNPVGACRPDCVSKDGCEHGHGNTECVAMLRDAPSVGKRRLMDAPQHEGLRLSPAMTLMGLCVVSSIAFVSPASAQSPADFYRGKN